MCSAIKDSNATYLPGFSLWSGNLARSSVYTLNVTEGLSIPADEPNNPSNRVAKMVWSCLTGLGEGLPGKKTVKWLMSGLVGIAQA